MSGSNMNQENYPKPLKDVCLVILGRSELKSSLLHFFLWQNGGANCTMYSISSTQNGLTESDLTDCDLVMMDVAGFSEADIFKYLALAKSAGIPAALFDVDRSARIEKYALKKGAKGFFYVKDPLNVLIKGVSTLVKGELWVPRNVMERCVLDDNTEKNYPKKTENPLTRRETEVLILLYQGGSNMDIAEKLFVSVHTIKTHIYNIYQKINVSNRMQAARWAAKHLTMPEES